MIRMTDIVDAAVAATKADIAALDARIAALESKASNMIQSVADLGDTLWHGAEARVATIEGAAAADFKTIWAHKTLVLFDVALIVAAFVAGHYI
jgi:hypothetical protein